MRQGLQFSSALPADLEQRDLLYLFLLLNLCQRTSQGSETEEKPMIAMIRPQRDFLNRQAAFRALLRSTSESLPSASVG